MASSGRRWTGGEGDARGDGVRRRRGGRDRGGSRRGAILRRADACVAPAMPVRRRLGVVAPARAAGARGRVSGLPTRRAWVGFALPRGAAPRRCRAARRSRVRPRVAARRRARRASPPCRSCVAQVARRPVPAPVPGARRQRISSLPMCWTGRRIELGADPGVAALRARRGRR